MPHRSYASTANYRFGFNGKENDNELKGLGNQLDFGGRIYDSRLGRWLSLDPLQKKYPWESHYSFTSDNPIVYVDADGKDKIITHEYIDKATGQIFTVSYVTSNDVKGIPIKVSNSATLFGDRHDTHWEYEWHDISQTVTHIMSNGVEVQKTIGPETLGQVRTTTYYNFEWFAKAKIARYEGGITFTSKNGGNGEVKTAILPVDVINIDALLSTFDVAYKANTTKNFYEQLTKLTEATTPDKKMEAIKEINKIIENTLKVSEKVIEKIPPPSSDNSTQSERYTPNTTVCLSCGKTPHGLTDGITDEEGNVKDTIKHSLIIKYNPKTKANETSTKNDTIPTKRK